MASLSRVAALACAAALAAACGGRPTEPSAPSPAPAPAPVAARPAGLAALRPSLTFSDGRTSHAGVAFAVAGDRPLAIVSSHVVYALLRGATLSSLELIDAHTKNRIAAATGLAVPAGLPMDGFDFSTDFAVVVLDAVPDGVARLPLAPGRPAVGDAITVLACPPDGDTSEVAVLGEVSYASSTRLEVQLRSPGATRGFSGAPILDATGRLVGVLQTVSAGSTGVALGRATPVEAVRPKVDAAAAGAKPLPLSTWAQPAR